MKKLLTLILLIGLGAYAFFGLTSGAKGNAFSWSWFSSIGAEKVLPKKTLQLETQGTNSRIYPFVYQNMQCIGLFSSEGVGVDCWKKDEKEIK